MLSNYTTSYKSIRGNETCCSRLKLNRPKPFCLAFPLATVPFLDASTRRGNGSVGLRAKAPGLVPVRADCTSLDKSMVGSVYMAVSCAFQILSASQLRSLGRMLSLFHWGLQHTAHACKVLPQQAAGTQIPISPSVYCFNHPN